MLNKIGAYNYQGKNPKTYTQSRAYISGVQEQIVNNKDFKSLYLPGGVSFKGTFLNVHNSTLSEFVPDFIHEFGSYRTKLAKAIGVTVESLKSILEPEELKEILKTAEAAEFSTGNNFENVLNGTFRINLHIHTKNSDGTLSVRELLDQAARYADYRKTINKDSPLVIAISDHDTLEGSREAIKIIAQNPEKYKNIRFVPAIEFNAKHNSRQLEVLAYCINPFEEGLSRFVNSGRDANAQYLKSFLESHVNVWEAKAGIPPEQRTTLETIINQAESKNTTCSKNIKFFGSPGLILGFTKSLKSIFYERGWNFDGIEKFAHEHGEKYKSFAINPGTPTIEEIVHTIKESGSGFVGIAHPCRNLGGLDLRYLFQDFKRLGIEAVEANYQYLPDESLFPRTFREHAGLAASINDMVKTGGSDNHSDNIFTNKFNIASLSSKVQTILNSSF